MIEKVKEYYQQEKLWLIQAYENPLYRRSREPYERAVERCYGVMLFARTIDSNFERLDIEYQKIVIELKKVLDKYYRI